MPLIFFPFFEKTSQRYLIGVTPSTLGLNVNHKNYTYVQIVITGGIPVRGRALKALHTRAGKNSGHPLRPCRARYAAQATAFFWKTSTSLSALIENMQ